MGPAARARQMSEQGYRLVPMEEPYCYRVVRPAEVRDVTGDTVDSYFVCIHPQRTSCDCAWFGQHGAYHACKHIELCRLLLRQAFTLISPVADMSDVASELEITDANV